MRGFRDEKTHFADPAGAAGGGINRGGSCRAGRRSAQSKLATDPKDQEIELLKTEIKQLESRVDTLEGLDQKSESDRPQTGSPATRPQQQQRRSRCLIVKVGDEGILPLVTEPRLQSRFRVESSRATAASSPAASDKNVGSTFFLNRVRPILTGSLGKYYNFNITPDFGQGRVTLQDAYINMTYWDYASLRTGKFKAPLDLERLQSDRDLEFSERSEIQNLVPNRDTGADLHGRLFDGRLYYDAALMNGVADNTAADTTDLDNNDGKDFVGRIFATHSKSAKTNGSRGWDSGSPGSYGDERGTTTSTYRTYGMSTWFTYNTGVTARACARVSSRRLYYYWRGLGLMAEYAQDEHSLNLFTKNGSSQTKAHRPDRHLHRHRLYGAGFLHTDR